ncbi:MAG: lipoyl(octanoyl) transferase [Gemmatimonadales bacterium]|nr:lipoyl(octanoyl) transferase [Gemmatimonadales bacterium]
MDKAAGQRGSGAAGVTQVWTLWVDTLPRPGWANMAIDHALLERAQNNGESWLRLYQWTPHCLSFGRHEPATRRYDSGRITELGLDTVRRPTGGRAVWHAEELTYSVAAPSARFGSLPAAYLEIHGMLADALRGVGVRASLAPPIQTPALDAGACFSQPSGGEIMIGGRKIVGSAQFRQGHALLQHGSILLEDNQSILFGLTRGAIIARSPQQTQDAPRNPPPPLRSRDVAEAITQAAGSRWPGEWDRAPDLEPALHSASSHFPHYRSVEWTWAR